MSGQRFGVLHNMIDLPLPNRCYTFCGLPRLTIYYTINSIQQNLSHLYCLSENNYLLFLNCAKFCWQFGTHFQSNFVPWKIIAHSIWHIGTLNIPINTYNIKLRKTYYNTTRPQISCMLENSFKIPITPRKKIYKIYLSTWCHWPSGIFFFTTRKRLATCTALEHCFSC